VSEKKPAASNNKKAGVDERHISTLNKEVRSRKPRPAKKLDYPEDPTRRPHRDNEEVAVAPSDIARAGEALLAKPNIQRAIAAALVMNEDGSTGEPSSITPNTNLTPHMRMQHKLLDQAQSRTTTSLAAAAPSRTDESHLDEDWGADAVASGHGAGQAASTENEPKMCSVCYDAYATHLFFPCGHFCICKRCKIPYENGTKRVCPICQKEFTNITKVFR